MPRSRSRNLSSSPRRSRSPLSDHHDRSPEHRLHVAELPQGTEESEVRRVFQRFGTLTDVWIAGASCFGFVVFEQRDQAQRALDEMDGRSFGKSRIKVTWARPRTKHHSQRYDPNMRCFKCGQRGHFSRECESRGREVPRRRREDDRGSYAAVASSSSFSRSKRYSRSRSPDNLPAPAYFRHGMPVYPTYSRRREDSPDDSYPVVIRSNGHDHRQRDRGTRLTPPSTSSRYGRR